MCRLSGMTDQLHLRLAGSDRDGPTLLANTSMNTLNQLQIHLPMGTETVMSTVAFSQGSQAPAPLRDGPAGEPQ